MIWIHLEIILQRKQFDKKNTQIRCLQVTYVYIYKLLKTVFFMNTGDMCNMHKIMLVKIQQYTKIVYVCIVNIITILKKNSLPL